jgi:predicted metal-dependent enzyme (double-stranded beta helix superfamily)
MNPEYIFKMFAKILLDEADMEFTLEMVDILNSILLTSNELFELRNILMDFDTEVCSRRTT